MDFSQILGFKHILDKVILGAFCQFFHPVWVILAHLRKTDASQNCWRLLSAIFKRAIFNHQNRITSRKMKVSQFLWNQKWFQVTYFSDLVKPKLVSQIYRQFWWYFFLWLGFMDLKLAIFWLKITISGVSRESFTKFHKVSSSFNKWGKMIKRVYFFGFNTF